MKPDSDNPEHYCKSDNYRKISQDRIVTCSPGGIAGKIGEVGKGRYQRNAPCQGRQLTQRNKNPANEHQGELNQGAQHLDGGG